MKKLSGDNAKIFQKQLSISVFIYVNVKGINLHF